MTAIVIMYVAGIVCVLVSDVLLIASGIAAAKRHGGRSTGLIVGAVLQICGAGLLITASIAWAKLD